MARRRSLKPRKGVRVPLRPAKKIRPRKGIPDLGKPRKVRAGPPPPKKDPYGSQVEEAITLKFGGAERELANEYRISDQQTANVGNWWGQYQRDVQAAAARSQAGYQQAQGQVYGQANLAASQDQGRAQQMDQAAQQDAASRGAVAGPSVGAQAASGRQALSSSFGGLIGSQGATHNTFAQSQVANAGGIRASELQKEGQRKAQLLAKGGELAREKGASRVSLRRELEADATKAAMDAEEAAWKRKLEAQAFGLKVDDTAADNQRQTDALNLTARDRATKNRLAKQKAARDRRERAAARRQAAADRAAGRRVTVRGQDISSRDRAAARRDGAAGGGSGKTRSHKGYGNTNVSLARAVTARAKWTDLVEDSIRKNDVPKNAKGLMRTALVEYARGGKKVSKATALKVYRTYGFRIPYGKPTPKRKPKPGKRAPILDILGFK